MVRLSKTVLEIDSLSVKYTTDRENVQALRNVSLDLSKGEIFGLAGESGSGKSTLGFAIVRYLSDNGEVTSGEIRYKGDDVLGFSDQKLKSVRGNEIAHVPQDPRTSLNPTLTIGRQIAETIELHRGVSREEARGAAVEVLRDVNISDPEFCASSYPHELSGGMQQRALIAIGLSCDPEVLILDEPTTGLDVTTQRKMLDLIDELQNRFETSVLLISHDLSVISKVADRVCILYAGEVMENGPTKSLFSETANPYTQNLLAAIPEVGSEYELEPIEGQLPDLTDIPDGCIFQDRCRFSQSECKSGDIPMDTVSVNGHESRCLFSEKVQQNPIRRRKRETKEVEFGEMILEANELQKQFGSEQFFDSIFGSDPPVQALDDVSFEIREAETLGLVGESGCGKSTLAKSLLNLIELTGGDIEYRGRKLGSLTGADMKEFKSDCQIVFQNPGSSLNPQKTISQIIDRPLKLHTGLSKSARQERVLELLHQVGLNDDYLNRLPKELSGGEQQRVAIARAFATEPGFIVLDEAVSSLDVSIQASILNLLNELHSEYSTSYLFVSHDLSVVNYISDSIAVMYLGEIVEYGSNEDVFEPPYHPYTQALLSASPSPHLDEKSKSTRLEGDVPSMRNPPSGCPFHTRCPKFIGDECEQIEPKLEPVDGSETHRVACHLDYQEMYEELDLRQ